MKMLPTTAMRGTDGALTDKTGFSLSTAGILAIWHQALSAIVTAGSVGKLIKDEITSARMATLTDLIDGGRLDLLIDAIKAVTDLLPDAGALTTIGTDTARLTAVRAAVLTDLIDGGRLDLLIDAIKAATDLIATTAATESYAADGSQATVVQLLYQMWSFLNSLKFVGTTGTSRKLEGITYRMAV